MAAEVEAGSGAVIARLVCPRRLHPGRRYRAALVPAFAIGADAALGRPLDAHTEARPAWEDGRTDPLELPLYYTWTFSTSPEPGDFEALCRRLEPDSEGGRIGYRPAVVVPGELLPPFTGRGGLGFEVEGALVDPDSASAGLGADATTWFNRELTKALNESAGRPDATTGGEDGYVPERDDPIVGPPLYGCWASRRFEVPAGTGWQRTVNLSPAARAAAGLGAELVRASQAELLAAAWDQVGQLREVNTVLNRGRLAAELGRSQLRRLGSLEDGALLAVTSRTHAFLSAEGAGARTAPATVFPGPPARGRTIARKLADSAVMPSGLMAPAYLRATRPSGTVARFSAARTAPLATRVAQAFVEASAPAGERPDRSRALRGVRARLPAGRRAHARVCPPLASDGDQRDHVERRRRARPGGCRARRTTRSTPCGPGCSSASTASRSAPGFRRGWWSVPISPTRCSRSCSRSAPSSPCPGSMTSATTGRGCWRSTRSTWPPSWSAPTRSGTREALWAEFPASLGATAFASFWESLVPVRDISPDIHAWPRGSALEDHVGGEAPRPWCWCAATSCAATRPSPSRSSARSTARRRCSRTERSSPEHVTRPSFRTPLDETTVVVGFGVDPEDVLGEGWYVCLEEPFTEPRVGLDEPDAEAPVYGKAPTARRGRTSPGRTSPRARRSTPR